MRDYIPFHSPFVFVPPSSVFLCLWTMRGKTGICRNDPDFQALDVNIFKETSIREGAEDDFQESFQNTESEKEAPDEEHGDCDNNTGNYRDDGYFLEKHFMWLKKLPPHKCPHSNSQYRLTSSRTNFTRKIGTRRS